MLTYFKSDLVVLPLAFLLGAVACWSHNDLVAVLCLIGCGLLPGVIRTMVDYEEDPEE